MSAERAGLGSRPAHLFIRDDEHHDPTAHVLDAAAAVFADLTRRATVEHVEAYGPIPRSELEAAAGRLREIAVELVRRGYPSAADRTMVSAERVEETAELALVMEYRARAAA